jgi:cell shape-determining protein MreD
MNNKTKRAFLLARLFGQDYLTDERIQSGIDQAGNYSFVLTMILLWSAMVFGVISDQIKLVMIPSIIFLLSCIFYLIFRVKNGSFQANLSKDQSKIKVLLRWFLMGIAYAAILFLLRIKDINSFSFSDISDLIINCFVNAVLWVFLLIFFLKFLIKKNDNILNKKMDE